MVDEQFVRGFIDYPLEERSRIAYNWIDPQTENLLDAGCSYGYATRYYAARSTHTWGIELDPVSIEVAKAKRYGPIEFIASPLETTPFSNEQFDTIIMTDVLEHVQDPVTALNELFRVLKPGGAIIITTPHKGLFSIFDPFNYSYFLQKYASPLYRLLLSVANKLRKKRASDGPLPAKEKHFHFSLSDFTSMLDRSAFGGKYVIEKKLRSGLFVEAVYLNLEFFLRLVIHHHPTVRRILEPLAWLADKDYNIPYGPLAYNIGLKIRKKK